MKSDTPPHIVFTGGGTGGHLFPGLAVAERLAADWPHIRITFAGCGKQFERQLVAAAGFDYLELRSRPLPRRPGQVLPFLINNWRGYRAAVRYLGWQRVAVVVGLGGYTSVPMARAAVRRRVPLVVLEQNVVPGRATRWLAPSATIVCSAFEQTGQYLPCRCSVRVTGNPLREGIARQPVASGVWSAERGGRNNCPPSPVHRSPSAGSAGSNRQLLVLGGSNGAQSLNETVPRALYRLGSRLAGWKIVHQSGQAEFESTRRLYMIMQLGATVVPFITDMGELLGQTDLAICRAGGTTLAELAARSVPAILLPYPHASDDHQRKNAQVFTAAGGCLTLDEREAAGQLDRHLAAAIARLIINEAKRTAMSEAIHRLAQLDATWDVATMIRHLA